MKNRRKKLDRTIEWKICLRINKNNQFWNNSWLQIHKFHELSWDFFDAQQTSIDKKGGTITILDNDR